MSNSSGLDTYEKDLPPMPEVAMKIMKLAQDQTNASFGDLERLVRLDPGLSTKILKIANSPLYARQREVTNLQTAISLLGLKNLRNIILMLVVSRLSKEKDLVESFSLLWRRSLRTAFLASEIYANSGKADKAEELFLAGLLSKIGQFMLLRAHGKPYAESCLSISKLAGQFEAERHNFGTDSRQVAAMALEHWALPQMYCDIARECAEDNVASTHKTMVYTVSLAAQLALIDETDRQSITKNWDSIPLSELQLFSLGITNYGLQHLYLKSLEDMHKKLAEVFALIQG